MIVEFVLLQEATDFATENELFYMETSAKDSSNVVELFTEIGSYCVTYSVLVNFESSPKSVGL